MASIIQSVNNGQPFSAGQTGIRIVAKGGQTFGETEGRVFLKLNASTFSCVVDSWTGDLIKFTAPDSMVDGTKYTVIVVRDGEEPPVLLANKADTFADLRATPVAYDNQYIELIGHTVAGVGGGGFYGVLDGSSLTDDNGVIAKNADGSAWVRPLDGFVTPEMFGAMGDGVSDDTLMFQSAINSRLSVYLPSDGYLISNLVCPDNDTAMVIQGKENQSIINQINGSSGFLLDVTGGYNISNVKLEGNTDDGTYGIGSVEDESAGGVSLTNVTIFSFDQCIYFGEEFEHPLGAHYKDVYCQNFNTSGLNIGGVSGAASSGESAITLDNVICTNPDKSIEEYASVVSSNDPDLTKDTITWVSNSVPDFGFLVLRSLDGVSWSVPTNWGSSEFIDHSFVAEKLSGEVWEYKVIRLTVGVNLRRLKAVNGTVIQCEYVGIGVLLKDVTAFSVGSVYSEIRYNTVVNGGFCALYANDCRSVVVSSGWSESYSYAVFAGFNSKVSVLSFRVADAIAAIANSGSSSQYVYYNNLTLSNTNEIYADPFGGSSNYNYEGSEVTLTEHKKKISHKERASIEVQYRGETKGKFFVDAGQAMLETNQINARIENKNILVPQFERINNADGRTELVDSVDTDIFEIVLNGSNEANYLLLNYYVYVIESGVIRQFEAGTIHVGILNVSVATPEFEITKEKKTQIRNPGGSTYSLRFTGVASSGELKITANSSSSLTDPSARLMLTPILSAGQIGGVSQL